MCIQTRAALALHGAQARWAKREGPLTYAVHLAGPGVATPGWSPAVLQVGHADPLASGDAELLVAADAEDDDEEVPDGFTLELAQ